MRGSLIAMRAGKKTVSKSHFEEAVNRVRPTVNKDMLEYYSKMEETLVSGLSLSRGAPILQALSQLITIPGFGREILNRPILDGAGDTLGHVSDLVLDTRTGDVGPFSYDQRGTHPALLPWPTVMSCWRSLPTKLPKSQMPRLR